MGEYEGAMGVVYNIFHCLSCIGRTCRERIG